MEEFDFNLRLVIKTAWKRKWSWFILHSIIVPLTVVYALFVAVPFYTSSVVISPKEMEGPDSKDLLSKLGGLGSMVGATLGMPSGSSADRSILIMQSGDFIADFIKKYELLPILFYTEWDSVNARWHEVEEKKQPNLLRGVAKMKEDVLVIINDASAGAITISMTIQDEGQSKQWVEWFLAEINAYLKRGIIKRSKHNQEFLRRRLNMTQNPIILEKVQSMLAYELEKEMLADDLSFDIIDHPVVPNKPTKPNKVLLLILAIFLSNFLWVAYVLLGPILSFFKYIIKEPDE
jgi:LPS O-antigen subunit length determinant protein (WzzB/FepE family)